MLDTYTKTSVSCRRAVDISYWEDVSPGALNARQKRRFQRQKAAVIAYFTTDATPHKIARQQDIPVSKLLALTEKCMMLHEDGHVWGFRALLPTAHVTHHGSAGEQEVPPGSQIPPTPEPQNDDEDTEIEDTEITVKRPVIFLAEAVKMPTVLSFSEPHDAAEAHNSIAIPTMLSFMMPVGTDVSRPPRQSIRQQDVIHRSLPETISRREDEEGTVERPVSIPTMLSFTIPVGTDSSRPAGDTIAGKDVIHRSLPGTSQQVGVQQADEQAIVIPAMLSFAMPVVTRSLRSGAVQDGQEDVIHRSLQGYDTGSYGAVGRRVGSGRTGPHKIVRKRRIHDTLVQTRQRRGVFSVVSLLLVALVLLGVLMPLGAGLAAYNVYNSVRGVAQDGVNHLLNVKNLLPISKTDPMAALDVKKLTQAQREFKLAEGDFVQLQDLTDRSDILSLLQNYSPDYANKFLMARHLVQVALDVSKMGQEVSGVAIMGAGLIHSSPLANGVAKPLVSVADIASIDGAIVHALYYINDIQVQMSQVRMSDVPISEKQKAQLTGVLTQLPKIQDMLTQGQGLVGLVSWLLGVGQARRFLVQTLDSAELRPSGGFTGQYGVLQIQDGRMAPFSLRDVALLDYAGNGVELGRQAPPAYSSWMNFGNWGLRDSNLSGDYPTTARMSMQVFQDEGGGPVDGDISFTPTFIGHILDVTGPIHVAEYNETITSKNLEDRLHYYQQDYSAIAIEHQKSNDSSHAARKAFTSLVGKMLLDRVRHLSTKQLLDIVKGAIKDIQSRDLEIYFANSQAEQWLSNHGYSGSTQSYVKQDGFQVVQANISISKASQFVHTTEHDDVVLDAQGGATHNLTITLDYKQTGNVYGYDTYADYIRVYAPQNAQFISGDGFDTGQALCNPTPVNPPKTGTAPPVATGGTTPVTGCSQYDSYFPSDARYCPNGDYALGDRGFQQAWTIDSLGAPTSQTSDLPGHAMWGGLTETPKNCISTISLSWYVPHAVKSVSGQSPYVLLVQKQGGYVPSVELTIDTSALKIKGLKPFAYKGNLGADKVFSLPIRK